MAGQLPSSGREGEQAAPTLLAKQTLMPDQDPRAGAAVWAAAPGRAPHSSPDSSSQLLALHGERAELAVAANSPAWASSQAPAPQSLVLTPSHGRQQLPVACQLSLPLLAGAQLQLPHVPHHSCGIEGLLWGEGEDV